VRNVPVAQHALLSDCGAAALVTAAGSVDWSCLPRFDSPPPLGRLLDDPAGHFRIAPVGFADAAESGWSARWRYRLPGLVLETTDWRTGRGRCDGIGAPRTGPRTKSHGPWAVDAAAARWGEDDQGIWEIRGPVRPLPTQNAEVLGGYGPRPGHDRAAAAPGRPCRNVDGGARGVAPFHPHPRVEPRRGCLYPVLRVRCAGRCDVADGRRRVPAFRPRAAAGHHRRHRGGLDRRARAALPLPRR
jgi:hypothetical protein